MFLYLGLLDKGIERGGGQVAPLDVERPKRYRGTKPPISGF